MAIETPPAIDERITNLLSSYPFLSYGTMLDKQYLGIIQNCDNQLLSIYVLTDVTSHEDRVEFLRLGETWWFGSNRTVPINIFVREFRMFRPVLKHFARKDFNLIHGPAVSLADIIAKRVRKKSVILVRDPE